jgi:hypothetical protein
MPKWRCPVCSNTLPVRAIDPKGSVCAECGSDLRIDQPFHGILGLSGLVIPPSILVITQELTFPWILLVVVIWPFSFGLLLLLIRRVIALPLTPMKGPFGHFTIQDATSERKDRDDVDPSEGPQQ